MSFIIYLIVIILVILDQISKYLTVEYLKPISVVEVIPNILNLRYAENTGAAFSMLEGQIAFFVVVTFISLALILYFYKTNKVNHIIGKSACVLIVAGAIGNLIDRVIHGFVVDMFEFAFIEFAIFNVADIFITFGGVLICYYVIFLYDKEQQNDEEAENNVEILEETESLKEEHE